MQNDNVTWQQGIAVVGGAFGICCLGFMLLHGMITTDRAFASSQIKELSEYQTTRLDRILDAFESYRMSNEKDHKEIMSTLVRVLK